MESWDLAVRSIIEPVVPVLIEALDEGLSGVNEVKDAFPFRHPLLDVSILRVLELLIAATECTLALMVGGFELVSQRYDLLSRGLSAIDDVDIIRGDRSPYFVSDFQ